MFTWIGIRLKVQVSKSFIVCLPRSGVLNLDNVDDGMVRTGAMCAENRV